MMTTPAISPGDAEEYIEEGKLDAVSFGLLHIANPDLTKRLKHGKPVGGMEVLNFGLFYGLGGGLEEQKRGYTDYPEEKYD